MGIVVLVLFASVFVREIASFCPANRCEYVTWRAWSSCTKTCGGGTRKRSRSICCKPGLEIEDCLRDCGIHDGGHFHEWEKCAKICYNGGVFSDWCRCPLGYYGSCCENRINCGDPGDISNGLKVGSNYYYNGVVTYSCDTDYRVSRGSLRIVCRSVGRWSGAKPTCTFFNTCRSNPCQNAGTCINDFERYTCICKSGFSGINCERDIQPPVIDSCPTNVYVNTTDRKMYVNWTVPSFYDPFGNNVKVSTNYPSGDYVFSWGDYVVQYYALKTSNGLSTQCTFNITVRPNGCESLPIPKGGALVCNGWRQDYGQFCMLFCGINFTVPRQYDLHQWYVCGASGSWIPSESVPNCTDNLAASTYLESVRNHYFETCEDGKVQMQQIYINILNSSRYKYFCDAYKETCLPRNVHVMC